MTEFNQNVLSILYKIKINKTQGDLLKEERNFFEALAFYKKALGLKPNIFETGLPAFKIIVKELAGIYDALGQIYQLKNDLNETISAYCNATIGDPENISYWIHFARSVRFANFSQLNEQVRNAILFCLNHGKINPQHLAAPGISLVKLNPTFQRLYAIAKRNDFEMLFRQLSDEETRQFLNDPLFLSLLNRTILPDFQIELLLTFIRRAYVCLYQEHHPNLVEQNIPFLYALAAQCHLTEYVYMINEEEQQWLKLKLEKASKAQITLIGSYRPLSEVIETESEQQYKQSIHHLLPINNEISQKVQKQYEENPYPRWTGIDQGESQTLEEYLHDMLPALNLKSPSWPSNPRLLIAGCGTGFHAISSAIQFKNSHVLAIDLSFSSLAYAMRKAHEMNILNIEFIQGDILNLEGHLQEKFDIIECSGVLHHMENPFLGWKILRSLLKPNAWMCIGLYSSLARQDITAARQFVAKNHYKPTLEGIRQCRQHLLGLPSDDILHRVTESVDFYSTSSCRDLLFNVHEIYFTIPQISEMIKALDLVFLGFSFNQAEIALQYSAQYPDDPEMRSLDNWHQFELHNPNTFMNMYQFWVKTK